MNTNYRLTRRQLDSIISTTEILGQLLESDVDLVSSVELTIEILRENIHPPSIWKRLLGKSRANNSHYAMLTCWFGILDDLSCGKSLASGLEWRLPTCSGKWLEKIREGEDSGHLAQTLIQLGQERSGGFELGGVTDSPVVATVNKILLDIDQSNADQLR